MIEQPFKSQSIRDLLSIFEAACLKIDESYLSNDVAVGNAEFKTVYAVNRELKARGEEARRALLPLLQNPNLFVRLHAAKGVYPAAPAEARKCLEELSEMKYPDVSLSAGMTLYRLEQAPHALD